MFMVASCVCKEQKEIVEHISNELSTKYECANVDKDYINSTVDGYDYCGTFNSNDWERFIPTGEWSAKATCCFISVNNLKDDEELSNKVFDWKCAKKVDWKELQKHCESIKE